MNSFDLQITQLISVIENDNLAIRNRDWKRDENNNPIYPPDILYDCCWDDFL